MRTWRGLVVLVVAFLVSYWVVAGGRRPISYFWSLEFAGLMALVFVGFFIFFFLLQRVACSNC
jgi:hypothetical protein